MMISPARALLLLLLVAASSLSKAQDFDPFAEAAPTNPRTEAGLWSTADQIAPGEPFHVVLKLTHPTGWHSYYKNPGIGLPAGVPRVEWTLPEGFTASEIEWPVPHRSKFAGLMSVGYAGTNYFRTTITPPDTLSPGTEVSLKGDAKWQMCKEVCIDESASFTITLPVGEQSVPDEARTAEFQNYAREHLPVSPPEGWKLSAEDDGATITLTIRGAEGEWPGGIFLYDEDAQVDAQKAHTPTLPEAGVLALQAPRNQGNSLVAKPGPVLDRLRGILAADGAFPGAGSAHGIVIDLPLQGTGFPAEVEAGPDAPSEAEVVTTDSPEELARMRELYDPDSRINFIPLKDIPQATIWTALFGAFVGGMILNLMPCVFPVLGIKVMGFVEQAGSEPRKVRLHGLVFTFGLLASMWILAGTLLTLKLSLGQNVNWGAQMGNPYFVAGIIILLFLLGLNMAGVFEMGTTLTSAGGNLQSKKGYRGSFFSGVLTTLIATPCSGPFLGAAMAYTLSQTAAVAMFLFTIFGLGIAFPYLALSFFPALIQKLPRPGPWMETFKQFMSFALFGTAAFFLKTFGGQTGTGGMAWLVMGLTVLGLAAYIYGRWNLPHHAKARRLWLGRALPAGVAATALWMAYDASGREGATEKAHAGGLTWHEWQPGKVELSRSKGRIVWVDYTADW